LGRTFTEDEGEVGHDDKVVLSYPFWQERYAGDLRVVGRQLRIDGRPYTIVGVMPKDFLFIVDDVRPLDAAGVHRATEIGRESPQQQLDQHRPAPAGRDDRAGAGPGRCHHAADMDRFPAFKPLLVNAGFHTVIVPLQDDLVREVKGTLYLLWGGHAGSCC